jgi:phage anti-repressor protein
MKAETKQFTSKNLKDGSFKEKELVLYETRKTDVEMIVKYQLLLPVLQSNDGAMIDARTLHSQLGIKREFAKWIDEKINNYGFEENIDYFTTRQKRRIAKTTGYKEIIEYSLTLETAKELTMVQNNEMGKVARKYFIAIERAFKNRNEWNIDRTDTLINCKRLQHAMIKHRPQLLENKPSWAYSVQQAEFCMFNNIVIGMSASDYRKLNGLNKTDSIRNTFSEVLLEYVADLEEYDAKLILTQFIFDYYKRQEILTREFINLSKQK